VNQLSQNLGKRLAKLGARLVFWDADSQLLEDLSQEFEANDIEVKLKVKMLTSHFQIITQVVDTSKHHYVKKALSLFNENYNIDVDILINATGITPHMDWLEESEENIDKIVDTNFKSLVWLTRAFLPSFFRRRSGHIVTIASTCGINPMARKLFLMPLFTN
jgi:NADP-dependent 3-hydroxy acid dehydrogenase YdfG